MFGINKTNKIKKYLGCSINILKKHLEKQFEPGMTWKNYGKKWHIDHIVPICSIKSIQDVKQIKKVCHYTNLRPLLAKDNLKNLRRIKNIKRNIENGKFY